MTTRPLSRWDRARRRMNGSATSSIRIVVISRVSQPSPLEGVLEGQAVDDGGGHAHVVGRRLLDHVGAAAELAPRRMLPPPTTIASWTPRAATRDAWRAIRLTSSTLMPPSPGRQKLSPESFSRTRRKTGGPSAVTRRP